MVSTKVAVTSPADLATTVINVEEQLSGWYALLRSTTQPNQVARAYQRLADAIPFLARFTILPFPEPAQLRFQHLMSLRLNIGRMDLRMAAIALEHAATVVTRNVRDFRRVPGLVIEDWSV